MHLTAIYSGLLVVACALFVTADAQLYDSGAIQQVLTDKAAAVKEQVEQSDQGRKYIIMFKQAEVTAQNYDAALKSLNDEGVKVEDRLPIINGAVVRMTDAVKQMAAKNDQIDSIEEDKEVRIPETGSIY
ncbi:hypothetical protein BDF19DRAFT_456495 [Syncephalis fuscata]|nr:hypothetical protein BDF19DRAFT_456495 [Syncephalis fuscata]